MTLLIQKRGVQFPVIDLLELADRNGITHSANTTAEELSASMQAHWLRAEEHQFQILKRPPNDRELCLLNRLGMVQAIEPPPMSYEGTLLLGATLPRMRRRLAFVLKQWNENKGLDTGTIHFLVNQRKRDLEEESMDAICMPDGIPFKDGWSHEAAAPETETAIARIIWEQSVIPKGILAEFVDTPLQPTETAGVARNPNTTDTVVEFMRRGPIQGTWLMASNQPFIQRHLLNIEATLKIFPGAYIIVEMGPEADPELPLKTYLDEVARLLYQQLLN